MQQRATSEVSSAALRETSISGLRRGASLNERRTALQPPLSVVRGSAGGKQIAVKLPFQVVAGQIPKEMLDRLSRDFTDEEREQIFLRCGRTLAPKVNLPDKPGVRPLGPAPPLQRILLH